MALVTKFCEFTEKFSELHSSMTQEYLIENSCFYFSNSGQRGGQKFFLITRKAMLACFSDIKNNLAKFSSHTKYIERVYRGLFSSYLTDPLFLAISTVQTKPLFILISKIIYLLTEDTPNQYDENYIDYDVNKIDAVILFLQGGQRTAVTGGYNKIYYGAPSTGKSYAIKEITETTPDTVIKTVFHADTQNSDFIGCLKPSSDGDDISYTFQPGPFTNALIKALNAPNEMHYLVIEEINRASAAAVFGEIFQLLDRDVDGRTESGYEITSSDPMHTKYIQDNVTAFGGKIYIPSNLTLLATMNSSDQAVMPMDTAFKRRWTFKYTPLDFDNKCAVGNLSIVKTKGTEPLNISWKSFALEINKILADEGLPEDRHLGPYFVKDDELVTVEKAKEALSGKVFMYLWDDILRHKPKNIIFNNDLKTNGALMTAFFSGEPVFNETLLEAFEAENSSVTQAVNP